MDIGHLQNGKDLIKIMKIELSKQQAYEIAKEYLVKYKFDLSINTNLEKAVFFYESFYKINGSAWVVVAKFDQNNIDDTDEMSFVVSDESKKVEYVMDYMGIPYTYHLTNEFDFSEEDIEELTKGE